MVDKLIEYIRYRLPEKYLTATGAFFSGLTVFGVMDILWRCATGFITIFLAWLAYNRHKASMEVKRLEKEAKILEIEKLHQEIGDLILSNKKKHG